MSNLPPDPDGMNSERTRWAQAALWAFQRATRTDDEDAVSDLLTDLMHWCDCNDQDFNAELLRGSGHYESETRSDTQIAKAGWS